MKRAVLLPAVALLLCPVPGRAVGPPRARPFEWAVATPASQGMSKEKLDAIKDDLARRKTKAFLVIRNDRVVYEWYAADHGPGQKHGTASLAKALVGGLSLAVALSDGVIALDDPAARFVPMWKEGPRKGKITVRHLGSHTAGLSDATTKGVKHEDQPGWQGDFWKRREAPDDPFTIARDKVPALAAPGQELRYSNPGIGMLT